MYLLVVRIVLPSYFFDLWRETAIYDKFDLTPALTLALLQCCCFSKKLSHLEHCLKIMSQHYYFI